MNEEKTMSFDDIRKMRRGTDVVEKYNFPFTEVPIYIRVLSQDEIIKAINIWREIAKRELEFPPVSAEIEEYSMRELLYKAILRVTDNENDKIPFFNKSTDVWELTADEWTLLTQYYNEVQEKYAPQTTIKTREDFENLISELKKKSPIGNSLSTYMLRTLVDFLIENLTILRNDNGTTFMLVKKEDERLQKQKLKNDEVTESEIKTPKKGITLKKIVTNSETTSSEIK